MGNISMEHFVRVFQSSL